MVAERPGAIDIVPSLWNIRYSNTDRAAVRGGGVPIQRPDARRATASISTFISRLSSPAIT